jgi:hydroxyisourate hydrolase
MTRVTLSIHVLDLDAGAPASALRVVLASASGERLAEAETDDNGRITQWPGLDGLDEGRYSLTFDVGGWYAGRGQQCFYPRVCIEFVADAPRHYHVPLLLNRHGYSTYRGS